MSKTCMCGHHAQVHVAYEGMCGSPEGCDCNRFEPSKPVPASPKRFAEMTGDELWAWAGAYPSTPSECFADLRDAILAERDAEWEKRTNDMGKVYHDTVAALRTRAERAEQKATWNAEAVVAAEQERNEWKAMHLTELSKRIGGEKRLETAERERDAVRRDWISENACRVQLEARLRTAESALGEAKREGHRAGWADCESSLTSMSQVYEMNRRYPAIDPVSGSTCKSDCARVGYCAPGEGCHAPVVVEVEAARSHAPMRRMPLEDATPQPEAIVLETSRIGCTVTITAPLMRRLLALAQTGGRDD